MSSTVRVRISMFAAVLILALASPAAAKSSLRLEVREHTKARLTSADVWLRTLAGKLVRKLYAAAGRVTLANAPVGTFNLEARTRTGNLVGRGRVVIKANALARAVIAVKPAPPKLKVARPAMARATRYSTPRTATPRRATPAPVRTVRRFRGRGRAPTARRGRRPAAVKPMQVAKVGTLLPASRDWGQGKVRVCRGDVLDAKGRRVSGKIQVYRSNKAIGHAKVVSGYFSLYDLGSGTYQLRFVTIDNKKKVNSNVAIVKGKLGKAVLRVP